MSNDTRCREDKVKAINSGFGNALLAMFSAHNSSKKTLEERFNLSSRKQIEKHQLLSNLKILYKSGKNQRFLRYVTDKAFDSVAKKGVIRSQNLHLAMDAVCEQMEIKTPGDEVMSPIREYLLFDNRTLDQTMFYELVDHMISCFINPENVTRSSCKLIK